MLEGLISSLLNRYLSSVVHLDSEQLNVGVWSGRLHLTNLTIRPSLFAHLPVTLRRGRIGSFLLQLNWAKLGSVPVQVTLDDVWLMLEAKQGGDVRGVGEWSEEEVRRWMEQQKQRILEEAFTTASSMLAASGEAGSGFAATFIASVVDNVQIHVNRVHVCVEGPGRRRESYEEEVEDDDEDEESEDADSSRYSSDLRSEKEKDNSDDDSSQNRTATSSSSAHSSAPSTPTAGSSSVAPSLSSTVLVSHPNSPHPSSPRWSAGVVLHSLSVVTTDSGGHQTFVKSAGSVVYKRVAVSGLSVYWDTWRRKERRPYVDADDDDSFTAYMNHPFLSSEDVSEAIKDRKNDGTSGESHSPSSFHSRAPLLPLLNYILMPTEATVRLELSKLTASSSNNETKKQPAISASVSVRSLSLQLNADQLRSASRAAAQLAAALGPDLSQQLRHAPLISPALLQPAAQSDARTWWRYAIGVHAAKARERREEQSWQRVLAARRDHDAYTPLYRAKLMAVRDGKAEDEWRRQQREEIEGRWPARTLLVWRSLVNQQTRISVAYNQVRQMNAKKEQQRANPRSYLYTPIATGATVAGWVGSLFSGGGTAGDSNQQRQPEMSAGERDQLSRLLGYDPMGPVEQLASAKDKDAPLYRVELELTQIALTLYQPAVRSQAAQTRNDELNSPRLSPFPHASPALARSRLDLAMLTISTLRAASFIQAAETTVQLEVGGLHVEDCMQRDSPQFRYLITSDARNVQQVTTLPDDSNAELGQESKQDALPAQSTSLIKVLYTHHDHSSKQSADSGEDGAVSVMEVEEMGVFTRTVSVAALPSKLLSVSDSVDLQFNTMHVNWNRTTISLLVHFLTAEDDEEDEEDEEEMVESPTDADKQADDEQKRAEEKRARDAKRNRRRTMPAAAAARSPSPKQPHRPALHVRTRSTPVLPAPQPLAATRSTSSSSSRLHPSDPRPLLRLLRGKLTNVSRYRQAREAAELDNLDGDRGSRGVRKLQFASNNKRRRQSDEAQLAREESASLLPRPAHNDTGKRELRYIQFKLNASMQSFSVCLNDELADVTLMQAEVTGLNLSLDQSQPDTGLRADPEVDGSSNIKQQTLQVRGTVGGITVYDTHTFTSAHPYSPHSPQSAGQLSSSINPAHFGTSSSALGMVPPRAATRVFFKHRSSDLALLTFSFTMQPTARQLKPLSRLPCPRRPSHSCPSRLRRQSQPSSQQHLRCHLARLL